MRLFYRSFFAFVVTISILHGMESAELGISFSIPKGFEIQEPEQPKKTGPEIYMIQSCGTNANSEYPLFLSLLGFNVKLSKIMMSLSEQMEGAYRKQIGSHSVLILPGFPGPFGHDAFFYIIPRDDGTSIGLMAPRFISERGASLEGRPPSGMDSIIESLIETLKFDVHPKSK